MSILRHWKIVVALTALFIVGVATGAVLTVGVIRHKLTSNNNDWPQTAYRLYKHRLKLTPEQDEKLKPTFAHAGDDLRAIRRDTMLNIFGVIRQVNTDVEKELTPEQKVEFEKLREEMRNKLEVKKKGGKI
jgi:hypothetical protein